MSRTRHGDAELFFRDLIRGGGRLAEHADEAEVFYGALTGRRRAVPRLLDPPPALRRSEAYAEVNPVPTGPAIAVPAPRGVAYDGTYLYTVHRTAGEVRRFDSVASGAGTLIATLPRPANGVPVANNAFVGPTFVRNGAANELVIAEFGDLTVPDSAHGSGRIHALSTAGVYRGAIATRSGTFLWGPAGSTDLGGGRLAQSSFWANRVTAMNVSDGASRVEVDFSGLSGRVGPDPLALHPSGNLVIGDRNNGRLLYAVPGGRAAELYTKLADPIGITCLAGGDVVVVTKGKPSGMSSCLRIPVTSSGSRLTATAARTLLDFPASLGRARGCTTIAISGRETVVVAIAVDGPPGPGDGLYFVDPS